MRPEPDPVLANWVASCQQAYWAEPEGAADWFGPALARFAELPEPGSQAGRAALDLALLLCQLAYELRDFPPLYAVVERALPWAEAAPEHHALPRLLCVAARLQVIARQYEAAGGLLQRASELLGHRPPDAVAQGLLCASLGQLALVQGQPERALEHARHAQRWYESCEFGGPWVHVYAAQAVALRELGWQDEREAVLRAGMQRAESQRRWSEAANLCTGLFDLSLEHGALDAAAIALAHCETLAASSPGSVAAILRCSTARLLAAQGRFEEACALLEPQIDDAGRYGGTVELSRRLEELAGWQARMGRGVEALRTSRRAHALQQELVLESQVRAALQLRQQVEREQAERGQAQQQARAQEAQAHKDALEAALSHLQTLQEELAERSRQASLGALLAGVAHELNTPLGTALTALSSSEAQAQDLLLDLQAGTLSRQGLQARLQALREGHALSARCLGRALELTESYRPAHPDAAAGAALAALVQRAWQRALSPASCLRLQLQDAVGSPCWPGQALEEVLVQLFQNVERHAYAPGEPGLVRVQAAPQPRGALLAVEDQGRGIAPELLPRVFEPYVSTQFGRGRSGLGLFIAEAAVRQQLGGRLRVQSQLGQGTRFEIECPLGPAFDG